MVILTCLVSVLVLVYVLDNALVILLNVKQNVSAINIMTMINCPKLKLLLISSLS